MLRPRGCGSQPSTYTASGKRCRPRGEIAGDRQSELKMQGIRGRAVRVPSLTTSSEEALTMKSGRGCSAVSRDC